MDLARDAMHALATTENAGLVMDFDGVLSPITDDPAVSQLLPGTAEILASLAGKLTVVALLSGRPAGFLAARATVPGVALYGSYGLERVTPSGIEVVPGAHQWAARVDQATEILRQELGDVDGLHVEQKSLSVAVHWRRAPDRDAAETRIAPLIARVMAVCELRREPGKFVEELRMPLDLDKGTALRAIIDADDLSTVAYAGDDRGDLPALAIAAARGHALVVDGPEAVPEVREAPGAHFTSPDDFQAWLRELDSTLG
ncbi:trehalose-phosphatase [Cellulosimicrobium sp. Marseille-Q4280]|uniref:trehalose-phosphatase n=1 Tax=Cellulosimicrobium sp. Marseille-Q4280 TaxID=2937992 RepID=UPI00204120E5|nr:trehalose-phosphatase [Cellulosimicrobium sp. Marseille-Q4280]